MPSSAVFVHPIQFVTLATLIFASTTFIMALIMLATFPILSVCFIMVYGTNLFAWSISVRRNCPLGDRIKA